MTMRTKIWIGAGMFFGPILIGLATPGSAPAWILHAEYGVALAEGAVLVLFVLAVLVTPARIVNRVAERFVEGFTRRQQPAVREVPASTGIQALGTFLDDGTDELTADHYGQGGVR
jgi:hypothetical protein